MNEDSRAILEIVTDMQERMATKDDIVNMATKDVITQLRSEMATKEDIRDLREQIARTRVRLPHSPNR